MEFKDYYKVLGVEPDAEPDVIKKAYKKLARRYHPDVSKEPDAEQQFKALGEAYEVLRDPQKRQEYDQMRTMGARGGDGQFRPPPGWESAQHFYDGEGAHSGFSDFFEAMFGRNGGFHHQGGGQGFSMRGEDVHAELALLLEEAVKGCEQVLAVTIPQVDARGLVSRQQKKLKVKVPPGSGDGSVLRIRGQGGPGVGGGQNGDLLVTIRLAAHPLFSVEGRHVSLVVPILPWEAAQGAQVTIPTLSGRTRVTVPANSQSGQKLRLPGKGMPGSPPGDFYVVLKVVMPEHTTDEEQALFDQLASAYAARAGVSPRAAWEGEK